jgi:hypothetical protein
LSRFAVDKARRLLGGVGHHFQAYRIANPSPHWADWGVEVCANGVDGTPPLPNLDTDGAWHNHLTQPNEVLVATGAEDC